MTPAPLFKLGKLPPRHDNRTLALASYLADSSLPVAPATINWAEKISDWTMMLNDHLGDCGLAGQGHMIQLWTANSGKEVIPSNTDVLNAYEQVSGYNPETGEGDNGVVLLDALNHWRTKGLGTHKIDGYMHVEPGSTTHIKDTIYLFGAAYCGVALPASAQDQDVWHVPTGGARGAGEPGSWGGHCVPIVAYDADYLTCITWGATKRMTWDFWHTYGDEAYAVLSQADWFDSSKTAPNRFDYDKLQEDLKKFR